jgi:steroid 5-alpha reductase family enzyme
MKLIYTAIILIFTIIVVPLVTFYFGTPLSDFQYDVLTDTSLILLGVILYCFIVGELSGNNSQVDKLWSIVPIAYSWHIAYRGNFEPRMILMASLVALWGIRLTYNFARRGAYTLKFWAGEEDYRWEVLRNRPGFNKKWVWTLFNFFFICAYQNTLIFLITLPILSTLKTGASNTIGTSDIILSVFIITAVVLEYIADQQQYDFQTEKYRRINTGEELGPYKHGFVRTGLWSVVRHPNYSMEQLIWILFYGFSIITTGEWIHWSIMGSLLLVVLFQGSSDFSESISAEKYTEYKDYQRKVPRFIPFMK